MAILPPFFAVLPYFILRTHTLSRAMTSAWNLSIPMPTSVTDNGYQRGPSENIQGWDQSRGPFLSLRLAVGKDTGAEHERRRQEAQCPPDWPVRSGTEQYPSFRIRTSPYSDDGVGVGWSLPSAENAIKPRPCCTGPHDLEHRQLQQLHQQQQQYPPQPPSPPHRPRRRTVIVQDFVLRLLITSQAET
ncbi:hypothetical protein BJV78DRAFT_260249 [Lactifluus subvellereus]|nr:hypothetical protein BJV78DRAFT_260249 [Lactifluus subvellereus]